MWAAVPAAALAAAIAGPAHAAEPVGTVVMFEEQGCVWCARWDREVGGVYPKTEEGRLLPLRRIEKGRALPPDLPRLGGLFATPTFVVVACGREIGRIVGYPGEEHFYGLLGGLIERIEAC